MEAKKPLERRKEDEKLSLIFQEEKTMENKKGDREHNSCAAGTC